MGVGKIEMGRVEGGGRGEGEGEGKLQALLYDILPLRTTIIGYVIGLGEKCQLTDSFYVDAQMAVSL